MSQPRECPLVHYASDGRHTELPGVRQHADDIRIIVYIVRLQQISCEARYRSISHGHGAYRQTYSTVDTPFA